ncbi:MAG: HAD family phosphatase [Deltaproteobacteria bacterium]|nr:HAD family phosphatase [Deltaproteobacteria bacterium]
MIKALLFDFDGVIVDTEPLHYKGFLRVMKKYGYTMTYEHYKRNYLAFQDRDCFIGILNEIGMKYDEMFLNALIEEKGEWFFPLLNELPIKVRGQEVVEEAIFTFEGLTDFIRDASRIYRLAIVSGAQKNEIEVILKRLGIFDCFVLIVSAGDYQKGKPDPEPYLVGYKRLKRLYPDVEIYNCVGVEDSFFGIKSVKSAGMKCIAVTNSYSKELLSQYGADLIVDRLTSNMLPLVFSEF